MTISLRHLGDFWISFADERSLANYPNGTWAAVEQVVAEICTLSQRSLKELKNDMQRPTVPVGPLFLLSKFSVMRWMPAESP
jgi:hypothetical protein